MIKRGGKGSRYNEGLQHHSLLISVYVSSNNENCQFSLLKLSVSNFKTTSFPYQNYFNTTLESSHHNVICSPSFLFMASNEKFQSDKTPRKYENHPFLMQMKKEPFSHGNISPDDLNIFKFHLIIYK